MKHEKLNTELTNLKMKDSSLSRELKMHRNQQFLLGIQAIGIFVVGTVLVISLL